eukprot:884930-Rhodomonas_salina.4
MRRAVLSSRMVLRLGCIQCGTERAYGAMLGAVLSERTYAEKATRSARHSTLLGPHPIPVPHCAYLRTLPQYRTPYRPMRYPSTALRVPLFAIPVLHCAYHHILPQYRTEYRTTRYVSTAITALDPARSIPIPYALPIPCPVHA